MQNTELPYYVPKHFPIIIRKNTSKDGSPFGQSDCEFIRPQQQQINKLESRIMQKLLRAGVTPIMPEDATVSLSNAIFGQVVKIRSGESASQYGTVDTTPDISQDIKEADRLYDHAKRLIGISDAYQGIDQNRQESGYAKELRINQSASRLESKRRMKNIAYERLYKLIFQHYLTFSDSEKKLTYKDGFGIVRDQKFDKRDFITEGEQGEFYYNDSFVFTTDKDLFAEYQREALWERNLANLDSGTLENKDDPRTLLRYWQFQQRAHYPGAKDNVDYFKAMIENERSDKNGA
jgi:hypothetical protein